MRKHHSRHSHNENDLYENLHKIKEAIMDTGDGVKNQAGDMICDLMKNIKHKSEDYQNDIEDYVSEKPFKSIGMALLAGVIIGKILL